MQIVVDNQLRRSLECCDIRCVHGSLWFQQSKPSSRPSECTGANAARAKNLIKCVCWLRRLTVQDLEENLGGPTQADPRTTTGMFCWIDKRSCWEAQLVPLVLFQDCSDPVNDIVRENCKQGSPATEWDINAAGSSSNFGCVSSCLNCILRLSVDYIAHCEKNCVHVSCPKDPGLCHAEQLCGW